MNQRPLSLLSDSWLYWSSYAISSMPGASSSWQLTPPFSSHIPVPPFAHSPKLASPRSTTRIRSTTRSPEAFYGITSTPYASSLPRMKTNSRFRLPVPTTEEPHLFDPCQSIPLPVTLAVVSRLACRHEKTPLSRPMRTSPTSPYQAFLSLALLVAVPLTSSNALSDTKVTVLLPGVSDQVSARTTLPTPLAALEKSRRNFLDALVPADTIGSLLPPLPVTYALEDRSAFGELRLNPDWTFFLSYGDPPHSYAGYSGRFKLLVTHISFHSDFSGASGELQGPLQNSYTPITHFGEFQLIPTDSMQRFFSLNVLAPTYMLSGPENAPANHLWRLTTKPVAQSHTTVVPPLSLSIFRESASASILQQFHTLDATH